MRQRNEYDDKGETAILTSITMDKKRKRDYSHDAKKRNRGNNDCDGGNFIQPRHVLKVSNEIMMDFS